MTGARARAKKKGDDGLLTAAERRGWALLVAASVLGYAVFGMAAAWGMALGGVLGLLNFRLMRFYFSRVLRRGHGPSRWVHVAYLTKFGALAVLLAAAFRYAGPHPLGVFAGFSILVVALVWTGLAGPGGVGGREAVRPGETVGMR